MSKYLRAGAIAFAILATQALSGALAAEDRLSDGNRSFLLSKNEYCMNTYTVAGVPRTDAYCLGFYRKLVDFRLDGAGYAFYCEQMRERAGRQFSDSRCAKAELIEFRQWREKQEARAPAHNASN